MMTPVKRILMIILVPLAMITLTTLTVITLATLAMITLALLLATLAFMLGAPIAPPREKEESTGMETIIHQGQFVLVSKAELEQLRQPQANVTPFPVAKRARPDNNDYTPPPTAA